RARAAPDVDPRFGIRGVVARRAFGGQPAGGGRGTDRGPGLARPDSRLPARRADGARGDALAAADRRVHPRSHRLAAAASSPGVLARGVAAPETMNACVSRGTSVNSS